MAYLPTSTAVVLLCTPFGVLLPLVAASEASRSTETVRLAGSPASFSIFNAAAATFSFLRRVVTTFAVPRIRSG